jgi:hypothetical protein
MEITLVFSDKKKYNQFVRNLNNGKGTVIKQSMLEGHSSGAGFFSNVLKSDAVKSIAKAGAKELLKAGTAQLAQNGNTGIASVLNVAGTEAINQAGKGFLGKVLKNPLTKAIVKTATPAIAGLVGDAITKTTGNKLAGDIFKVGTQEGVNQLYQGQGAKRGRPVKGSAEAKERMAKARNARKMGGSFRSP